LSTEEIIISFAISVVASIFTHLLIVNNDKYQLVKKIAETKIVKVILFVIMYILPVGTISVMIADDKTEPTFKNISLFIIICVTFIYNILMSHIRQLYSLNMAIIEKNTSFVNSLNDIIKKPE
jgi:quinol-cytochrome oxidoreductase complex cytochrome b subunit